MIDLSPKGKKHIGKPKKILYIPIEVFWREFPSRAFLSYAAALEGFRVIIGTKSSISKYIKSKPLNGIYFYKGAGIINSDKGAYLKALGFKLVAQYEEAPFVYQEFKKFFEINNELSRGHMIDRFYCWGGDDFNFLKNNLDDSRGFSNIFELTGSPRTVVWGNLGEKYFEEEVNKIKNKFHNFILINTNFAAANSIYGEQKLLKMLKKLPNWSTKKQNELERQIKQDTENLSFFTQFIEKISDEIDINIIIRPHPIENNTYWKNKFKKSKNVFINNYGSVTPWIVASQLVIHNGCTTGVESVCQGKPTFALIKSSHKEKVQNFFPNKVSIKIETFPDFLNIYTQLFNKKIERNDAVIKLLNSYLYNYGDIKICKDIIKSLKVLDVPTHQFEYRYNLLSKINDELMNYVEILHLKILGTGKSNYYKRKDFTFQNVNRMTKKCEEFYPNNSRVMVSKLRKDLYLIENQ